MKIVPARPPNFQAILAVFPLATKPGVVFCFGDTIFAPGRTKLPSHIVAHEEVHSRRQRAKGVEEWWAEYLASPSFRLDEELPAHRAEYQTNLSGANRNVRRRALAEIATKLASPIYGRLVSVHQAKQLIGGADANLV